MADTAMFHSTSPSAEAPTIGDGAAFDTSAWEDGINSALDKMARSTPVLPQTTGEPGPTVPNSPEEPADTANTHSEADDLAYFRSLPEQAFQSLYPRGITPPDNLGAFTPYDKYDQFQQALLHLAAGVPVTDVMRISAFDINAGQLVKHIAVFCVKSLDYTDADLDKIRDHLQQESCMHKGKGEVCDECVKKEFISVPGWKHEEAKEEDNAEKSVVEEVTEQVAEITTVEQEIEADIPIETQPNDSHPLNRLLNQIGQGLHTIFMEPESYLMGILIWVLLLVWLEMLLRILGSPPPEAVRMGRLLAVLRELIFIFWGFLPPEDLLNWVGTCLVLEHWVRV